MDNKRLESWRDNIKQKAIDMRAIQQQNDSYADQLRHLDKRLLASTEACERMKLKAITDTSEMSALRQSVADNELKVAKARTVIKTLAAELSKAKSEQSQATTCILQDKIKWNNEQMTKEDEQQRKSQTAADEINRIYEAG